MSAAIEGTADQKPLRKSGRMDHDTHLLIGLVNNMPASSRLATERQFRNLIASASGGIPTELLVYVSPRLAYATDHSGIPADRFDLHDLWGCRLDGLIVTGSEPVADCLTKEPNWDELAALVDWAEDSTYSAIWSCLAAHAAVYRLDGVARRRLPNKLFGLFECTSVSHNEREWDVNPWVPDRFWVPHSRWNDIFRDAHELSELGYRALSQSQFSGPDIFVRKKRSLFVFCQGHPEYETDSLLLEYRRDVARFLRGERGSYPELPHEYFDDETEARMLAFRDRAVLWPAESLLCEFPVVQQSHGVKRAWHSMAVRLYHNWLLYLSEQKTAGTASRVSGIAV
jgi:homoserine O-succinyltransferase